MTEIRLKAIRKEFGAQYAVDHLDLTIETGQLVALLGPSGGGKSTTLRMIAGLETPSQGQIFFDNQDITHQPVQARHIGMVFQRYALFPHMTVEKNIAFGLRMRKMPKNRIAQKLDEILDIVQLGAFRHRFPAQLSGGQMQRVAIARTLVTEPKVLMMDEPLSSLDTQLRSDMRRFIRNLQKRMGITTIFVTHDQIEAMELADKIAVLLKGRLAQYDTPARLYQAPSSLAVAEFMGVENIFSGHMVAAGKVALPFGTLDAHADIAAGQNVHVMLRSEMIDIAPKPTSPELTSPAPPATAIAGRIVGRDFFGASFVYDVDCAGHRVKVTTQPRTALDIGADIRLSIAKEHVWVITA